MDKPKILLIDIETTPIIAMLWATRKQNVSVDQILEPHSILCFAYKWLGDKAVSFVSAKSRVGSGFTKMIQTAYDLISEADMVCHFNGRTFDMKRLNNQFVKLGLTPPPPIPQIDLKEVVFKNFDLTSSKLAFVGPYLEIGKKVENEGWPLWQGCLDNDELSWYSMERYNKGDVTLLERLYKRLLPWIDNHPHMALYTGKKGLVCRNCNSSNVQSRGYRATTAYLYQQFRCNACGRWGKGNQRKLDSVKTEVR